ncbi:hypothetical protein EYZ11_011896 [Aspergillus tanneri]|uniref:Uncharacterized protein n=1 Tax=Aspergillus tanneri TaxID=1220188 RepID=A0A4S3J6Z0_9EURO|nr:hypothetical protein EYZ11_011896 [Aspergillus tanneri]
MPDAGKQHQENATKDVRVECLHRETEHLHKIVRIYESGLETPRK